MKSIDLRELEGWQQEQRRFALIDVLPNHALKGAASPGAHPSGFMEHISTLSLSKDQPVILYEAGSGMIELDEAVDALSKSGFCELYHFVGPQTAFHTSQHVPVAHDGN